MRILWSLLVIGAFVSMSAPAHAHAQGHSYLVATLSEQGPVELRWDLALHDLIWSVYVDTDYDGIATPQEVEAARATITNAVLGQLRVTRGDAPCLLEVTGFAPGKQTEEKFLAVSLRAHCAKPGRLAIDGPLFLLGESGRQVFVYAYRGKQEFTGVIRGAQPSWREPEQASAGGSFVRFIGEGIWHVFIGYDHIAFVLLLLLPAVLRPVDGQWQGATGFGPVARDIVTIVTAFTLAHSTTLALAVTGTVKLPLQPIEVAIAASIAVAGALNLMPSLSRWRLALAFGFGLVHGFGFANALSEIETGGASLLPLLAGFNIGVEIAQLGIVAVVLPLIYLARDRKWYSGGVLPLGSCALGAAGVVWVVQRL